MKVYIAAYMEGVAGVACASQLSGAGKDYPAACRLLLGEVNAAIQGAAQAGAREILVLDRHGSDCSLPADKLNARARYIFGAHWPQMPEIRGSDALILLGCHAMAGTEKAVADRTVSSERYFRITFNDVPVGDIVLDAAAAGFYRVPVVLVTGCGAACAEAENFLPGVVTAKVKDALWRYGAITLAPAAAREMILLKTREALEMRGRIRPFAGKGAVELKIEYHLPEHADAVTCDGIRRIRVDERTIAIRGENIIEALSYVR